MDKTDRLRQEISDLKESSTDSAAGEKLQKAEQVLAEVCALRDELEEKGKEIDRILDKSSSNLDNSGKSLQSATEVHAEVAAGLDEAKSKLNEAQLGLKAAQLGLQEIEKLKKELDRLIWWRHVLAVVYALAMVGLPILGILIIVLGPMRGSASLWLAFGTVLVSTGISALANLDNTRRSAQIDIAKDEVKIAEAPVETPQDRAQKAFLEHQVDLKKYYSQALQQNKLIFWIGIIFVLIGIAVFFGGLWVAQKYFKDNQVTIAVVSAVGALCVNFIAGLFLVIYQKTADALLMFHGRLFQTHHAHFGNLLITDVQNPLLRDWAYTEMALALLEKPAGSPGGSVEIMKLIAAAAEERQAATTEPAAAGNGTAPAPASSFDK